MRRACEVWSIGGSLVLVVMLYVCATSVAWANPYGIAGTGVLTKLGMPLSCSEYSWDTLQPSNPINMVRPCKYWLAVGGHHQYWGYHESTESIDNPAQFEPWVTSHLGKTWIIGNEPDLGSQDGLSIDQYARMFHYYYTFIKPLDPTAKFAIGGATGGSIASTLTSTQNWYQQVLTTYQTLYGTSMPIDVWNVHSYCGAGQIEDPDKIINEFVSPFVLWCHTVQGGAYASCPVWITECPVGEWNGAMSPENVIYFMQLYMPRLEEAGIEKWFWYVSNDWDGNQGSCCLTNRTGQVTPVGSVYSALANSYPNLVPAVVPFVPLPTPETVLFDFSGAFGPPWFNKAGWWSNTGGELRHTGIYPFWGTTCCPLYVYQDLGLSFKMKINSAPADINWAGVLIRAASRLHTHSDSGYLFFVRKNGEAALYNKYDGVVVSVPGAVPDPTAYQDYQVYISGFHITCYIDGVKRIDWTDPNARFASGYVSAQVYKSDASYDDFALAKFPRPQPTIADDGVYTTNLSFLHAAWDIADTEQTGFQYSVGLSAGATDVIPWTYTTDKSSQPALTLNPASTYYVNVRAVYPGGILGPIASTDGIIAAVGAASIDQLKRLTANTFCLISGKVVSGLFSGGFYIQEPQRASGIKVVGPLPVQAGDTVTLVGRLSLDGKEAALVSPVLVGVTHGDPPQPLGMTNRTIGGGGSGLQAAVVNNAAGGIYATGLCTTGLLAKTTGLVTYAEPNGLFAYIDDGSGIQDGSGHVGVKVWLGNGPIAQQGALAVITGWCSATDVSTRCARLLKPRSASDVYFSDIANYLANVSFETGAYPPWVYSGTGGGLHSGTWLTVTAHTGSYFFGSYGAKVCYSGTLYQTVDVPPGDYIASVWSVLFHPSTSNPEVTKNRVGIDPTGGADPNAPSVVWSDWDTTTGMTITPWHLISTPSSTVVGGRCTIFLQYLQNDATKYHLNCFDDAVIAPV